MTSRSTHLATSRKPKAFIHMTYMNSGDGPQTIAIEIHARNLTLSEHLLNAQLQNAVCVKFAQAKCTIYWLLKRAVTFLNFDALLIDTLNSDSYDEWVEQRPRSKTAD
jgi:hypothetical protein